MVEVVESGEPVRAGLDGVFGLLEELAGLADVSVDRLDLRDILLALRGRAAYVVLDAPSTAVSADAQCLARLADAAISVVELRRTTYGDVQDAADQLRQVGTPLLGAVVLPPGITAAVGPSSARHESHHEQNPPHSSTAQDTDATRLLPVVRADAEPRRRRPGKGMS